MRTEFAAGRTAASYYRQDAAMTGANAYAAPATTSPVWEQWPAFGALGWQ